MISETGYLSRQTTGKRLNPTDFYATPPWCYENLNIDWSAFSSAHEPCRGDGRIQFFLEEEQNLPCTYSEINEGKDFFDNHISGGDVIHGGRNFIPNTSLDWHDLCKKNPSWKKLNE